MSDNFPSTAFRPDDRPTEPDVCECERCKGSGTVARSTSYPLAYRAAGPVPDDARGVFEATCDKCHGIGYIEVNRQAQGEAR
jgi:DnaJ-class molecular chaperone